MAKLLPKDKALQFGQAAFDYVQEKIHLGASNRVDNLTAWNGNTVALCVTNSRKLYQDYKSNNPDAVFDERLYERARIAEEAGCGNCLEQTSLAVSWLLRSGVKAPIEFLQVSNGDHAFCVLNRSEKTDVANPHEWNEAAVYIDPWRSEISLGQDMARSNRFSKFGLGTTKYHFTALKRWDPA